MRTKGMIIAVVVLVAAAISVVVSVASAGRGHHNNRVFVAQLTEQTHTEATPGAPGPSQGDLYVFAGPLSDRQCGLPPASAISRRGVDSPFAFS
jgi:hypothetical protein